MTKKAMHRMLAFGAFAVSLSGCAALSVAFTPTSTQATAPSPRDEAAVEVLTLPPGRPYVELGSLEVSPAISSSDAQVTASLKREAAHRGCDAVVIKTRDPMGRIYLAACVRYTEPVRP